MMNFYRYFLQEGLRYVPSALLQLKQRQGIKLLQFWSLFVFFWFQLNVL